MKSIVVYRTTLLIGALMLTGTLMAQKPAIDLISSHQQYRHPEALVDTGYAKNPALREADIIEPPQQHKEKSKVETRKKKRRQIGPSLDSIFQKEEAKAPGREDTTAKISSINKRFNPLKIMIFIIAIK
jgi:hypothetical protein